MTPSVGRLAIQEWMIDPETKRVMAALQATGTPARFVGGCVRNALVNKPVADIDIATSLIPERVIEHLESAQIPFVPTGLLHGTITALPGGKPFEITTLRRDMRHDGRHADVVFTDDWKLDASRRDFTINAMSCTEDGVIYDYFNGIQHLREGRVVFVGDPEKRIREDVLRLLRYFRFLAQFGQGTPDAAALKACRQLASLLPRLSADRIRQEVFKLLETPKAASIWGLMINEGVVAHIIPEAMGVKRLEQFIKAEEITHVPAWPIWRLAALLDLTEKGLKNVTDFLKLSNKDADMLGDMLFPKLSVSVKDSRDHLHRGVYRLGHDVMIGLVLMDAARLKNFQKDLKQVLSAYQAVTSFRPPSFPLTGRDVLDLGLPAGPEIGQVLSQVEEWWIESHFKPGRTACLEELKNILRARRQKS